MTDFVEQCRAEWRRLGVAAPAAEEMAAELAADLEDAAADGVGAEQLLGGSYADPRAFAAAWAGERGIVPQAPRRRRPLLLGAFTALAALALVVAAVLLATGEPKVSLHTNGAVHLPPVPVFYPPGSPVPAGQVVRASAAAPIEWLLLALALVALGFAGWVWSGRGRPRARLS